MSSYRWGSEGPPPEAYSRVTNPERFAYLHEFAGGLIDRLEATYAIERVEEYGLDPELETVELARPSVRLTPEDADAAPILFIFTAFPGLKVRFGRWRILPYPDCACDACDETAESETEALESRVNAVTAGRFREEIVLPVDGEEWEPGYGGAWQSHEFWSPPNWFSRGSGRIRRAKAQQLLSGSDRSLYEWKPWPVR